MNPKPHRHHRLAQVALAVCALLAATAASALAQRTFVSRTGVDTNPCSVTLPCRNFAAAIAQTSAGGEVVVLDSAGYGSATITQSVSIIAPAGIYAGVSVFSLDGITINAGAADVVKLRGLRITGLGGANGIVVNAVGLLDVAGVEISGFTAHGLDFKAQGAELVVADSVFANNGGSGLNAQSAAATSYVTVRNSRFNGNDVAGVGFGGNVNAGVFDSAAANNLQAVRVIGPGNVAVSGCRILGNGAAGTHGVYAEGAAARVAVAGCSITGQQYGVLAVLGANADVSDTLVSNSMVGFEAHYGSTLSAERSTATGGTYGFLASDALTNVVRMSNCTATFNSYGVYPKTGSFIYSRQNNTIRDNGTDVGAAGGTFATYSAN